jgi:hypothetical protein
VTTNVVPKNLIVSRSRCRQATIPASQVPLERRGGGVLLVTVEINGTLTMGAMIDSGAAAVMLPADVFARLQGVGAVEADLGGEQSFTAGPDRPIIFENFWGGRG